MGTGRPQPAAGDPVAGSRPAGRNPAGSLLTEAIEYALRAAAPAGPGLLARPTPCRGWDLRTLLRHVAESLAVIQEGLTSSRIALYPGTEDAAVTADPLAAFRDRAARLLTVSRARHPGEDGGGAVRYTVSGHCRAAALSHGVILIGGHWLPRDLAAGAGALEVSVHGWDIAQACGSREPVPAALAARLLGLAPLLVPAAGRAPLFAEPGPIPPAGSPGDQLTAYLGRSPGRLA
jgi:uncharacterized protein (TIGR03083 family)